MSPPVDPRLAIAVIADAADKIETLQLTVLEMRDRAAEVIGRQAEELERLKAEVQAAWSDAAGWYRRAIAAETELEQRRAVEDGRARRVALRDSLPMDEPRPVPAEPCAIEPLPMLRGSLPPQDPAPRPKETDRSHQIEALLRNVAQRLAMEESRRN